MLNMFFVPGYIYEADMVVRPFHFAFQFLMLNIRVRVSSSLSVQQVM